MRRTLAIVAAAGTLVDSVASWYSIEHLGIAAEGNPLLNTLAENVGFAGAMAVRAVVGISLIGVLYFASIRAPKRASRIAVGGLWLSAVVMAALAVYHGIGIAFLA